MNTRTVRLPDEPQRHRDTEKRKAEKRRETAKEPRKAGKEQTDASSFLVSWVP
jgi:hypothetical protein